MVAMAYSAVAAPSSAAMALRTLVKPCISTSIHPPRPARNQQGHEYDDSHPADRRDGRLVDLATKLAPCEGCEGAEP